MITKEQPIDTRCRLAFTELLAEAQKTLNYFRALSNRKAPGARAKLPLRFALDIERLAIKYGIPMPEADEHGVLILKEENGRTEHPGEGPQCAGGLDEAPIEARGGASTAQHESVR